MALHFERQIGGAWTAVAGGSITANTVLVGGLGSVTAGTATSEVHCYVAKHAASSGDTVDCWGPGDIATVKVGAAGVTVGLPVMWATGAKVVDANGNVKTIGIAQATGVDGDLVPVLLIPSTIGTG